MSNEENLKIARHFRETLWTEDDPGAAAQIIAPECEFHGLIPFTTDFSRGPEAIRQLIAFYRLSFSAIRMTVERTVAEGDFVAVHWTGSGRHTGDLLGMPPTGREVRVNGIDLLQLTDGQIGEAWLTWNAIGLLEQLMGSRDDKEPTSADLLSLIEHLAR